MVGAEVGDGMVVMSLDSGRFYQLNRVAARLWKLLETPVEFSSLCNQMQEMFEIEEDACRHDVSEFLLSMQEQGILRIEGSLTVEAIAADQFRCPDQGNGG